MKFTGKWVKLGKNYPECGKPESVRQIWYILTYELIINYKESIIHRHREAV